MCAVDRSAGFERAPTDEADVAPSRGSHAPLVPQVVESQHSGSARLPELQHRKRRGDEVSFESLPVACLARSTDRPSRSAVPPTGECAKVLHREHTVGMTDRDDFLTWVNTALYEAEVALHNGDASPRRALWSRTAPVSPGCVAERPRAR